MQCDINLSHKIRSFDHNKKLFTKPCFKLKVAFPWDDRGTPYIFFEN